MYAPVLENMLHNIFKDRRINKVNRRKEFFSATIDEIVAAVGEHNAEIEITKLAEAEEYRKSLAVLQEQEESPAGAVREIIVPEAIRDLLSS